MLSSLILLSFSIFSFSCLGKVDNVALEKRVADLETQLSEIKEYIKDLEERIEIESQKKIAPPSKTPEANHKLPPARSPIEGPTKDLAIKNPDHAKNSIAKARKALCAHNLRETKIILEQITQSASHPEFLEALYHLGSFYLYQEKDPSKAGELFSKAYLGCLPEIANDSKRLLGIRSLVKFSESLIDQKDWPTARISFKECYKKIEELKKSHQGKKFLKEIKDFEKSLSAIEKKIPKDV